MFFVSKLYDKYNNANGFQQFYLQQIINPFSV